MDPLQIGLGAAIVIAVATGVGVYIRSVGLRRRLFVAIALASLLPAAGVATLLVSNARSLLAVLEAPGLREGVDAGLGLARAWLESEERFLERSADVVAAGGTAAPTVGWSRGSDAGGVDLTPWIDSDRPAVEGTRRVESRAGVALVLTRRLADGTVLRVGRRLPDGVVEDLERAQRGSQGFRQLELFYRPLLATALLTVAVIAVVAIALIGTWLGRDVSRRLVRPIGDLVEGTRRVAAGDLESRVETRAVGEVAELVDAFNGMTLRLAEGERRLRRSERLAAWQGIARRLAHEIKNPLTPIQLAVHRLRSRADDPVARESLTAIEEEVVNLQRLAEEFSALGRLPDPRPGRTALASVLRQAVELYVPHGIEASVEASEDAVVWADPGQLRQVVSNLVKNAVQAMGARGRLEVVARIDGGDVDLVVDDDGPGLGDEPDRVFDAGFTTRATGTGLGLAIVQRIVEDHGGRITAGVSPRGGARFAVRWPAHEPSGPRGSRS